MDLISLVFRKIYDEREFPQFPEDSPLGRVFPLTTLFGLIFLNLYDLSLLDFTLVGTPKSSFPPVSGSHSLSLTWDSDMCDISRNCAVGSVEACFPKD